MDVGCDAGEGAGMGLRRSFQKIKEFVRRFPGGVRAAPGVDAVPLDLKAEIV